MDEGYAVGGRCRRGRSRLPGGPGDGRASWSSTRPRGSAAARAARQQAADGPGTPGAWCRGSTAGCCAGAVADATAAEIDTNGIIAALRLAGAPGAGGAARRVPDCVLLDGNHDYLTPPRPAGAGRRVERPGGPVAAPHPVRTHPDQGRPHLRERGRGQRAGQDDPRRLHGGAGGRAPRVRVGDQQGLRDAAPPGGAARARARAPYHRVSWRLGLDDARRGRGCRGTELDPGSWRPERRRGRETRTCGRAWWT